MVTNSNEPNVHVVDISEVYESVGAYFKPEIIDGYIQAALKSFKHLYRTPGGRTPVNLPALFELTQMAHRQIKEADSVIHIHFVNFTLQLQNCFLESFDQHIPVIPESLEMVGRIGHLVKIKYIPQS